MTVHINRLSLVERGFFSIGVLCILQYILLTGNPTHSNNTGTYRRYRLDYHLSNPFLVNPRSRKSNCLGSRTFKPPYIKIGSHPGRLGNYLFQFASSLGISLHNNLTLVLDDSLSTHSLMRLFDVCQPIVKENNWKKLSSSLESITGPVGQFWPSLVQRNQSKANLEVYGYMQSYKYFQNYSDVIKRSLTLTKKFKSLSQRFFHGTTKSLKQTPKYFIGIHVRRGDMVDTKGYYTSAPILYFKMAIEHMIKKFGRDLVFVVASDDIPWCKQHFTPSVMSNLPVTFPNMGPLEDMAILINCNHTIMSTGTYSWWAAWLAGGHVVYYSNYPGTIYKYMYNPVDYYLPDWVGFQ